MQKIASFQVDHDLLEPGIYISRVDGDVVTYDLRTRKPNGGSYMDNYTMHTVEHLMATYLRNSRIGPSVLYFGPMGCQTGFYLLVRNTASNSEVLDEVIEALEQTMLHEGPIFGASRKECGHFEELDLGRAQDECRLYAMLLLDQRRAGKINFKYPKGEDEPCST